MCVYVADISVKVGVHYPGRPPGMPSVLLSSQDGGMCREESAEAVLTRVTTGEGPNFVLRTWAFVVRVTVDIGDRTEMRGAGSAGTGRNPGEDRNSVSRHPLTGGTSVPEQMQFRRCKGLERY